MTTAATNTSALNILTARLQELWERATTPAVPSPNVTPSLQRFLAGLVIAFSLLSVVTEFVLVVAAILGIVPTSVLLSTIIGLAMLVAVYLLNRQGYFNLASWSFCIFVVALTTFLLFIDQSAAASLSAVPTIGNFNIVFATMLLSRRSVRWIAAVNILVFSSLFFVPTLDPGIPVFSSINAIVLVVLMTIYDQYRTTLESIRRAELVELNTALTKSEAELQIVNTGLEKRVEERTEQLLLATKEAERANQVKSAFLASMSHELRTPLNAIINFSKFLKKQVPGPLNTEQSELIGSIAESGQHLLNLINDVLDMSKIESGSLKLYVEKEIDIHEILQTAIGYIHPLIGDKPIEIQRDVPENLPPLTGDRKRLLQIFLNILSNACKFTDSGHIHVKASAESGKLIVSVADTGQGIAPEDAEYVFTAFKQTESGLRQGGGTGLGMPICQRLVQAHEGRVWFESQRGQGTTFFVELPLQSGLTPERSS